MPVAMLIVVLALAIPGFAQTTISTGGIQGTVTDPSGALVSGAKVSLANVATGDTTFANTNSAGAYTFAFLSPDDYVVRIEANGFKTTRVLLTVKVDQTANGSAKLVVGDSSGSIEVLATSLQVNTVQPTVQGVLTSSQIANLPVNGRNFTISPSSNRASRFKMVKISILQKAAILRFLSVAASAGLRVSKWMGPMFRTKR